MRPKSGRKPQYPRQARVVMTDDMYRQLDARCDADGISACELIRRALDAYLTETEEAK